MIIVDDNTKQLQVKLGGAITTNELDWNVSYGNIANNAAFDGVTSGATPVPMVPVVANPMAFPPISGSSRSVGNISVFNADTVPQVVSVIYLNGSTSRTLVKINLGVNYTLGYENGEGWYTIDDNGARVNIEIALSGIAIGDTVVGATIDELLYVDSAGTLQQIVLGSNLTLTGNVLDAIAMGGEDLAATLALGNITGSNNIVFSNGYGMTNLSGQSYLYLGGATPSFTWTPDGGSGTTVKLSLDSNDGNFYNANGTVQWNSGQLLIYHARGILNFTGAAITPSSVGIQINASEFYSYHGTQLSFDSPLYHFASLTASRVPYIDASSNLVVSAVTPTELGYLSGVTSSIQTQINNINSGLSWKLAVRVATTANITLSGTQTIDGVAVIAGDRVLVKNQTAGAQNGIYVCAAGAWSRATDATTGGAGSTGILGATMTVEEGTVSADFIYTCSTNAPITIGTTALTFIKTSATTYTADEVTLTLVANQFSIKSTYVGQASITTLGTITTGVWNGTTIAIANGGTNNTAQVTNGVNYFDGTKIKSLATFLFDGTNLGIGATPDSILTVAKQTTIIAPISGTSAHYVGLDANPLRVTYDTHNTGTSGTAIFGRRSRGTAASPSAVASGDTIYSFNALGYGATGYAVVSTGLISFKANEAFTDSAMGTYVAIFTTPDGSVTAAETARFKGDGSLNLAQAAGVYQINGTTVLSSSALGSGVTGSSLTSVGTIGTGVWQGTVVGSTYGGTGINNAGRTITVNTTSAIFTFSGAFTLTVPATGTAALGTGGTNQQVYWSGTNTLVGNANTLMDGTSYLFGYSSLASTELAGFQKNQNGGTIVAITNTTSGTGGLASLNISNSSTLATSIFIRSLSALYTTSGINVADAGVFGTNKAAGLNIGTTTATQMSFWTNNTEQGRFLSTGEFLLGYTALASTETWGFQKNQNGATYILVSNTTSGTAGRALIDISNSSTDATALSLQSLSAAYTTSGMRVANTAVILSSKGAGLNIGTSVAQQMSFWTNNVEVARFNSTGEFGIGMTPVQILDITLTQNNPTTGNILNSNASGAAQSRWQVSNGTYTNALTILGTGFTTSGLNVANVAKIVTTSTVGLIIQSNVASTFIWMLIGGITAANEVARFDVNGLSFQNVLNGLTFKVQTGSLVGRTTLVAGTKAVTITGLTTSHKAFVTMQAAGGTIGVIQSVCTVNTLTLTSIVAGGIATQVLDTSTLDYFIIFTN